MRISDWSSDLAASAAVGPRIEHTGDVARPRMRLAVIGEPEAAMRIEDDVVGATQRRAGGLGVERLDRSEEHTSELQSLMRISYAVFCLKKKKTEQNIKSKTTSHT